MSVGCRIAVLAKAPLPGYAKTRLIAALGAAGAAALAERLLAHAAAQAVAAEVGPVTVWAAPDPAHPAFGRLARRHGLELRPQGEGDLGARMAHVFEPTWRAHPGPLLLWGTAARVLDAAKLPFLWTAKSALVRPSQAYALPVESSDFRYFIRARAGGTSIYHPEGLNAVLQGSGSVRLRKVLPPDQGRTLLEGTLVMQERVNVSPHDLLWIRLPLPTGRVDLYGHLYTTDGLAQGEARFRTVPQLLPLDAVTALRAAEGVSFARSPFEVVPLLSTPCDLICAWSAGGAHIFGESAEHTGSGA